MTIDSKFEEIVDPLRGGFLHFVNKWDIIFVVGMVIILSPGWLLIAEGVLLLLLVMMCWGWVWSTARAMRSRSHP